MDQITDGTAAGLLSFIEWTISRHELVPATATTYRTAARRVLEGEGDPASIDLRRIDVDELLRRFANRRRGDFKEQSLNAYAMRFRQALSMYLSYLDGGDWRPTPRAARRQDDKTDSAGRRRPSMPPRTAVESGNADTDPPHPDSRAVAAAMITFPLPIRPGVRGQLVVPEDLTAAEAQRISQVVAALVVGANDPDR